jgi:hypothetical protein
MMGPMRCRPSVRSAWLVAGLFAAAVCTPVAAFPPAETGSSVRDVQNFDRVALSIRGELILTQGERESLTIEASAADLEVIATEVRGGTLQIGQAGSGPGPRGPVTYRLSMKRIAGLATSSSGNIQANSIEADSLSIAISSSGSVVIGRLAAKQLQVSISSSGSCTIGGTVDQQRVQLSSSGEYRAENLASRTASVGVSSSGSATIRVSESLDARISSSGSVRYRGNPPRVSANSSSSGRLIKLD